MSVSIRLRITAFAVICMLPWLPREGLSEEPSGSALREMFVDPPTSYRPLIITHSGPLRNPELLQWLDARGVGGAVIDAGVAAGSQDEGEEPWNNPTYLNDPAMFDKLREVIAELRRKDQTVWLYDELGYPSASAGGRVLDGHPEYQVTVVGCRTFAAEPGKTSIHVEVKHDTIEACWAVPRAGNTLMLTEAIDLASQAGKGSFDWEPPRHVDAAERSREREGQGSGSATTSREGSTARSAVPQWVVCLFERYQPDTWRRHNIPRRNVNILDRDAIARFIEITHQTYARELGNQLQEVELFFTDEPQFGSSEHWSGGLTQTVPAIQWCPRLAATFEQKKGYALREVWPALFLDVGPKTSKYRYDFYDVQSDIMAEDYYGQIEQWCHRHGVASSGHMLLEESLLFHVMFSGSMIKNWSRMDLPGVDLLGTSPYKTMGGWNHNIIPVPEDFSCKLASSVAHLQGKQGVFTESYAVARDVSVRQVLGVAAWQFAGGITHMCTYSIQNQLSADDYGTFADFAGRLALLCRHGQPIADVAVLVPEPSVWASYTPPDTGLFRGYARCNPQPIHIDHVFRQTCHALLQHQRDFECFSDDFLEQAEVASGQLALAGQRFALLLVPEARMVRPATLDKIQAFLQAGGHVAFIGSLPHQSTTRGEDPGMTDVARKLMADFPQRAGHWPELQELDAMVDWMATRVPPILRWQGPRGVRILHRRQPQREILLLANPGAASAAGHLVLPRAGLASVWNPETGEVQMIGSRDPSQSVPVEIPGESARFVVVERQQE